MFEKKKEFSWKIPTLVLLKDGQFIHRMIGFNPKKKIEEFIARGK